MKKKLLSILLLVFVIATAFTTNVFADTGTFTITRLDLPVDGETISSPSLSLTKTGSVDSIFAPNCAAYWEWFNGNDYIDASSVNDGKFVEGNEYRLRILINAESSIPSESHNYSATIDGESADVEVGSDYVNIIKTYTAQSASKTVADIIATNPEFPTSELSAWVNENSMIIYSGVVYPNSVLRETTGAFVSLSTVVTQVPSTNDYTCDSYYVSAINILFNMDENDKLESITVSGCSYEALNGTYKKPTTIGDVLAKSAKPFPTSSDYNAPNNAWTAGSGMSCFITTVNNYFKILPDSYGIISRSVDSPVSKSGENYVYRFASSYEITFNIKNNVLDSITFEDLYGLFTESVGTYSPPKTIEDILPSNFPTTSSSGWVEDGQIYKIYHDGSDLKASLKALGGSIEINMSLSDSTVLTKDGNVYKCSATHHIDSPYVLDLPYTLSFEIEGNSLKKIYAEIPNGGSPGNYTFETHTFEPYQYTNPSRSVSVGYSDELEFVTNAVYINDNDVTVKVDGAELTLNEEYTLSHGSTHVKLKGDYVKTLSAGTHTISIGVVGYSDIESSFAVSNFSSSSFKIPNTGVEVTSNYSGSLLKLSSLSLLVIGTYMAIKKKKDNK